MKIRLFFYILIGILFQGIAQNSEEKAIASTLDAWHEAAAQANFETYFGLMTEDAVFLGTDATENWQNKAWIFFKIGESWGPGQSWAAAFASQSSVVFIFRKR